LLVTLYGVYRVTKNTGVCGDLMIVYVFISINVIAWNDGGLHSRAMIWFATLPIIATFLGGKSRAMMTLFGVGLNLVALLVAHKLGVIESSVMDNAILGRAFAFFASVLLVSVLALVHEQNKGEIEQEQEKLKFQ